MPGEGSFNHRQANCMDWKFANKMHCVKKDLWEYEAGTKEDQEKDTNALSYIVEGVNESIFNDIRELSSGKEAWKVLSDTYDEKGTTRKVSVIKEFANTRYIEFKDMTEYLHKMIPAYQQLKSTGTKPDEKLVAGIILANLPDRFDPLIMALKNCGEDITVDYANTHLVAEESKPLLDSVQEQAFVSEKFKGKRYFKGKRFNCNIPGHKSSDCQEGGLNDKFGKKASGG